MNADVLFGIATLAVAAALVWGLLIDPGPADHPGKSLNRRANRR